MTAQTQYIKSKNTLINGKSICIENRELFKEFFDYQERKLKRINNSSSLDDGNFKTLLKYVQNFRTVNIWFNNKPWKSLTEDDIKKVYDDIEDGVILTKRGKKLKAKKDYYNKIFKSKPFELAGVSHISKSVIEYNIPDEEIVRFFKEEDFLKMVDLLKEPLHKLLFWLSWDVGENINSILKLKKNDFTKQQNPYTREDEYLINLPKSILKRSRKTRTEITNHKKTVQYIDIILKDLKSDVYVFPWGYGNAKKILQRVVNKTKVVCIPNKQKVTWKDFRSSMACYLLKQGWTTNEINARLGHTVSSTVIDKYVNFLAIDRHTPKKKLEQTNIENLKQEVDESKKREKLLAQRLENFENRLEKELHRRFEQFMKARKIK